MLTRRDFHKCAVVGGAALVSGAYKETPAPPSSVEVKSKNTCDLLLKGGIVIDPSQQLHSRLDVAIKNGKILDLTPNFPEDDARKVFSVRNQVVTPGLIDLHAHCFDGFGGVNADHYCLARGVTAVVDCGSAGHSMINGLVKYIVASSETRVFALVDIGALGTVVGTKDSMKNLDWVDATSTARSALENKPAVVGIKVRLQKSIQGANDLECLRRAVEAAEACQLPLMAHISDPFSPLPQILAMLRKGDVFTHIYSGHTNGILDNEGKIIPAVIEARRRGIICDPAHGRSHFSFDVAERALQQGFLPDTISTDLSEGNVDGPVYDLPTTLSKFLALGMDLDSAIERATIGPARVFQYGSQLGTLSPGTEADCAIFDIQEGKFHFTDSDQKVRVGDKKLVNKATVRHGRLLINQA